MDSLIGILGPPRSGTTLIANSLMSHSKTTGIVEPYQIRRDHNYLVTDPILLLQDFSVSTLDRPHVFVKETTTRLVNVKLTLELMRNAQAVNVYTGLVIVLRCPFSAYLSQVEASRTMWNKKLMTQVTEDSLRSFARSTHIGLKQICLQARAQHARIVSYESFCASPEAEMARLMALVPLHVEPKQLRFVPPKKASLGGDPKAVAKAGGISVTSRSDEVEALIEQFGDLPATQFFLRLRDLTQNGICDASSTLAVEKLSRLVIMQESF